MSTQSQTLANAMKQAYGPTWDKARTMWGQGATIKAIASAIGRTEPATTALIHGRRKAEGVGAWPLRNRALPIVTQQIQPPLLAYRCQCGCIININVTNCN